MLTKQEEKQQEQEEEQKDEKGGAEGTGGIRGEERRCGLHANAS